MKRYNFTRPLLIIAVAYFSNTIVTNLCLLLGSSKESASNIGFLAMIVAAFITFNRLNKRKRG